MRRRKEPKILLPAIDDSMNMSMSEDGSSLIELAIILPVVLLIAVGMFDYAFWIQTSIQMQEAAAAGAAFGAVPGNATNSAGMVQAANYSATGSASGTAGFVAQATNFYTCTPGGSQVTAQSSCPAGAPFHYVQVTTSITSSAVLSYGILPSSRTLTGTATYRVEVLP